MRDSSSTFATIDDYIAAVPEPVRGMLLELRATIRAAAPGASEKISYRMPTYYLNGNLVHFAAFASHIGFYPTPTAIEAFEGELGKYKRSKGAVQFPLDAPLPLELVSRMVEFRVGENTRR